MPAGMKRRRGSHAVHTGGHAADNLHTGAGKIKRKAIGCPLAIGVHVPRADHADRQLFRIRQRKAPAEKRQRRAGERKEAGGKFPVPRREQADLFFFAVRRDPAGPLARGGIQNGPRRAFGQSRHTGAKALRGKGEHRLRIRKLRKKRRGRPVRRPQSQRQREKSQCAAHASGSFPAPPVLANSKANSEAATPALSDSTPGAIGI